MFDAIKTEIISFVTIKIDFLQHIS